MPHVVKEPRLLLPKDPVAGHALDPFLRWAGGKRWLVPELLGILGTRSVDHYHEPFLGGGSVFFSLDVQRRAHFSDLNAELIEVYTQVRDDPSRVAELLSRYENTHDGYYAARASMPDTGAERAARFIYLNHTSFNGIFRVNLQGQYNVPYGRRAAVRLPDAEWLARASEKLKAAELSSSDFEVALGKVRPGDLVFLDPPYTVAHNKNGFIKYNQRIFSFEDQERLARALWGVGDRGAHFVLTNAAHESIDRLFGPLGRKITVSRRNAVGGKEAARGRAEESVFTNIGVM